MRRLRHVGLAVGLLIWASCSALLLYAEARHALHQPKLDWASPLAGVVETPPKVPWTWSNLLHARAQAAISRSIGQDLPVLPWAVRLRNQAEWTLLNYAAETNLLLGAHAMLVEQGYAIEYCSRDIAKWRPGAVLWAQRIRQMQDLTARRGHAFLYVLTPSKVSQYPELLPSGYTCPASFQDRNELSRTWLAMLRDAGVHVADTTAPLMAAHAALPFRLFPNGGAHWNSVGQAIGVDAVVTAMIPLLPNFSVARFAFAWTMRDHPIPPDNDLADVANLMVEPQDPSPEAFTTSPPDQPGCKPPHIVIVGGSFSQQIEVWLSRLPCSPPVVLYNYWQVYRFNADGRDVFSGGPIDPAERNARVLAADLLIYEENEQVLGTQRHGTALWEMMTAPPQ